MNNEFLGVICTPRNIDEVFNTEYNDDGRLVLMSNETFHHDDDEYSFDFRVGIIAVLVSDRASDYNEAFVLISAYIMPNPEFWCDDALKRAYCGYDGESREEMVNYIYLEDAVSENLCVRLGEEQVDVSGIDLDDLYNLLDNKDVKAKLEVAAGAIGQFNDFRGFVFDAAVNSLGVTNRDVLNEVLLGKDALKAALGRLADSSSN